MIGKVQLRMNPITFKASEHLSDAEVFIVEPNGNLVKCELPRRTGSSQGAAHAAANLGKHSVGKGIVSALAETVVDSSRIVHIV